MSTAEPIVTDLHAIWRATTSKSTETGMRTSPNAIADVRRSVSTNTSAFKSVNRILTVTGTVRADGTVLQY